MQWGPNVDGGVVREAVLDRALLFDNYQAHTRHCPHCRRALTRIQTLGSVCNAIAVVCGVYVIGAMAAVMHASAGNSGGGSAAAVEAAVGAVVGASLKLWLLGGLVAWGVYGMMKKLERGFWRTEWHHAINNKKLIDFSV